MRVVCLIVALAAGCSFRVTGLDGDLGGGDTSGDLASPSPPPGSDGGGGGMPDLAMLPPGTDLSTPPDLTPPPVVLTLATEDAPATVDLTAEGTVDWIKSGINIVSTTTVHKMGGTGGTVLSDPTGAAGAFNQSTITTYFWSDGDRSCPTQGDDTFVYVQGQNNTISVTAKATTTSRTLRFYAGTYKAAGQFTASLRGQTQTASVAATSGRVAKRFVVTYQAAPGDVLTLSWTRTDSGGSNAGVDVGAVTVGP